MEALSQLVDIFLHLDKHLEAIVSQYAGLTCLALFLIVSGETGLVVTPLLPRNSLLFAAGAIASLGPLYLWSLLVRLMIAAILGDTVNYWVGHFRGRRLLN